MLFNCQGLKIIMRTLLSVVIRGVNAGNGSTCFFIQ